MESKVYMAKADLLIKSILWGSIGISWIVTIPFFTNDPGWVGLLIVSFALLGGTYLVAHVLLGTYYQIIDGKLKWHTGPFRGSIEIARIREIKKETNSFGYSGIAPSLAVKPMLIKYNKYDDIIISPLAQQEFISELIALNPSIGIVD